MSMFWSRSCPTYCAEVLKEKKIQIWPPCSETKNSITENNLETYKWTKMYRNMTFQVLYGNYNMNLEKKPCCGFTFQHRMREMNVWMTSCWRLTCSESVVWDVGWPAFPYPWPWAVSSRPVRSTAARQFLLLCRREKYTTHWIWKTHHDWLMIDGISQTMYHHIFVDSSFLTWKTYGCVTQELITRSSGS